MNWLRFHGFAGYTDEESDKVQAYFESHPGITVEDAIEACRLPIWEPDELNEEE